MGRIQLRSYYRLLIILVGLACASILKAELRSISQNALVHYLGLSIGGGECNNLGTTRIPVSHKVGGTAALAFHYEMQYRTWFWGVGLEGRWQMLNNATAFTDSTWRVDIDGDSLNYQYVYNSFKERDMIANIGIPIYVGKQFSKVYALVGLRIDIPIWAKYTFNTNMHTQGIYSWSISPIVSDGINDFSSLGFYPAKDYTCTDTYQDQLYLTPFVELGYDFLHTENVNMRVGAYASYAIPLSVSDKLPLADYSAIDSNPNTQNQQNMEQHIRWNSLMESDIYSQRAYKLEVGLKLTMLFNVTVKNNKCMCIK